MKRNILKSAMLALCLAGALTLLSGQSRAATYWVTPLANPAGAEAKTLNNPQIVGGDMYSNGMKVPGFWDASPTPSWFTNLSMTGYVNGEVLGINDTREAVGDVTDSMGRHPARWDNLGNLWVPFPSSADGKITQINEASLGWASGWYSSGGHATPFLSIGSSIYVLPTGGLDGKATCVGDSNYVGGEKTETTGLITACVWTP